MTSSLSRFPAIKWLLALGILLMLAGCSILPQSDPLQVYRLPMSVGQQQSRNDSVEWTLRVDTPKANYLTSGVRIAVIPENDNEIRVYKGVRWSDPAPKLIRDRLLEAFRADGRILRISGDDTALYADYILAGHLAAFQAEYRNDLPEAVLRFDAQLVDAGTRRIVAAQRFTEIYPVDSTAIEDVVSGFGRTADALSRSIVDWVISEAEKHRQITAGR